MPVIPILDYLAASDAHPGSPRTPDFGVRGVNIRACPCDSTSPVNRESSLPAGQSAGRPWSPAALPQNRLGRQPPSPAMSPRLQPMASYGPLFSARSYSSRVSPFLPADSCKLMAGASCRCLWDCHAERFAASEFFSQLTSRTRGIGSAARVSRKPKDVKKRVIPKSKGLTRRNPKLIPNFFWDLLGLIPISFWDLVGIDPKFHLGSNWDLLDHPENP